MMIVCTGSRRSLALLPYVNDLVRVRLGFGFGFGPGFGFGFGLVVGVRVRVRRVTHLPPLHWSSSCSISSISICSSRASCR